jgi:hypothetical protein
MTLTAKEYKAGLGKREASLIAGLAERDKTIFTVEDAKAPRITQKHRITA